MPQGEGVVVLEEIKGLIEKVTQKQTYLGEGGKGNELAGYWGR